MFFRKEFTMQIIDFTKEWLEQAQVLAQQNYDEARAACLDLPDIPVPPLDFFAENGMGAAAVEGDTLLGFLSGYPPFTPVYCTPDLTGVWSPLHAHAVQKENRVKIWQRLYQAAAEKWVRTGAECHSITLYTHDTDAVNTLFYYGFGARCTDLIRPMTEISSPDLPQFRFTELPADETKRLRPMRRALADHLGASPSFMMHTEDEMAAYLNRKEAQAARMFAVLNGDEIVAYIEMEDEGEAFATCAPGMWNICGAYCLPEYRGQGVAQALLAFIVRTLRAEGATHLGVDCETFNPTAIHFWSKYFTPYTTSVVRRIDENALLVK